MIRKGRFRKPTARIAECYDESVSFDWPLYHYDIAGSLPHAAALICAGIISLRNEVALAELKKFSSLFDNDVAKNFDVRSAVAKTRAIGALSAENIAAQIKRWRYDLGT
jgi:argininosuccinate lyase